LQWFFDSFSGSKAMEKGCGEIVVKPQLPFEMRKGTQNYRMRAILGLLKC